MIILSNKDNVQYYRVIAGKKKEAHKDILIWSQVVFIFFKR